MSTKAKGVDFQDEAAWIKILYVELTGLFGTISKVVRKLGLIRHNWVRSSKCNLVYLFIIKISTEATWPCHFYVVN